MSVPRLGLGRRIPCGMALGPLLLITLWCASSALGALDRRVLSAPWTVVSTLGELIDSGRLPQHLLTSARRAGAGLGIGVAAGTLLALISGLSRLGEALLDGPVRIKRAIPTLALIPLLIPWFGIGEPMKISTVALAVMVPVYLHFLMGLRLAVTVAWLSLVVVEQINATSGIGYMMSLARSYGQTEIIIVGLAVYGSLGFASDGAIRCVERRALSWRRTLAG